jgi:hypothetical protein
LADPGGYFSGSVVREIEDLDRFGKWLWCKDEGFVEEIIGVAFDRRSTCHGFEVSEALILESLQEIRLLGYWFARDGSKDLG